METNGLLRPRVRCFLPFLTLVCALFLAAGEVCAQTRLLRSEPANGATGVATSTTVVFYFSDTMDPDFSTVGFYSLVPFGIYSVSESWNPAHTILTCTPDAPFPAGIQISWVVEGVDGLGLDVSAQGAFTTGGGGGGTGSGTNRLTGFVLGKIHSYDQSSAGAPVLDANEPYMFSASTSLASNRTATAISLQSPGGTIANLSQTPGYPELWLMGATENNLAAFDTAYPAGDYVFGVLSSQSNQMVTVNLPPGMAQPNAPHLANYAAAQTVNPAQPFTLNWDAFSGGTAADYIYLDVDGVWKTPDPFMPGALNGTATSATIPGGTLQPNTIYDVELGFYRSSWTSNATYTTTAYRATTTRLTLNTSGTAAPLPVLTNAAWGASGISFEVETAPGQMLTVISTADLNLPVAQWPVFLTTNSPGTRIRVTDSRSLTWPAIFYRVRNGP